MFHLFIYFQPLVINRMAIITLGCETLFQGEQPISWEQHSPDPILLFLFRS